MKYDKESFLAGITVGSQLKGWASSVQGASVSGGAGGGGNGAAGGVGPWYGDCTLGDNIPSSSCGEDHGLKHLDYKLVNCAISHLRDQSGAGNTCLCTDNFSYGPAACDGLHGLKALDYKIVDTTYQTSVIWGYYADAS